MGTFAEPFYEGYIRYSTTIVSDGDYIGELHGTIIWHDIRKQWYELFMYDSKETGRMVYESIIKETCSTIQYWYFFNKPVQDTPPNQTDLYVKITCNNPKLNPKLADQLESVIELEELDSLEKQLERS